MQYKAWGSVQSQLVNAGARFGWQSGETCRDILSCQCKAWGPMQLVQLFSTSVRHVINLTSLPTCGLCPPSRIGNKYGFHLMYDARRKKCNFIILTAVLHITNKLKLASCFYLKHCWFSVSRWQKLTDVWTVNRFHGSLKCTAHLFVNISSPLEHTNDFGYYCLFCWNYAT